MIPSLFLLPWLLFVCISPQTSLIYGLDGNDFPIAHDVPSTTFRCQDQQWAGYYSDPQVDCQMFHICVHRNDKIDQFSFMCPNQTVFDQKLLVCVWLDNFDCSSAPSFYYVNEGVFEDLGNDFESPETRSEGRSLGLEGIALEAEDLSLTEVEKDISTLGKSLSYDTLETPNLTGQLNEAKGQDFDKSFNDDHVQPNLSQKHQGEFNIRPTPKGKKQYSTTPTTKASEYVKYELRKTTTQDEISKNLNNDSKLLKKQDEKYKENKLDFRKTGSTTVPSSQPSLQPKQLTNKSPTKSNSPAKSKELSAKIKPKQQQVQLIETTTKPYLSLTSSSPESRKKSLVQIRPNEKTVNRLTTQLRPDNILEKGGETTKQSPENIQSRTTLKAPTQYPSVGENSLPQGKPSLTSNLPLIENKKSSLTINLQSTKKNASHNNFNTKVRTGIHRSNLVPDISKENRTNDLNINDRNEKSDVISSELRSRARERTGISYPPQRPLKEKLSSSPRNKLADNLISQHTADLAGAQKAFPSPINIKETKQNPQRGEKKEIFKRPTNHTKSLHINKSKQRKNIQRSSNIVRGISKSVTEKIESDNKIRVSSIKQDIGRQKNNEGSFRQPIKPNANNRRQKPTEKILKPRPKLTGKKGLKSGSKSPSNGLTAYGILQQLLQNVTIIRSKALTEADPSIRGRLVRRNRTANFSNAKSFDAYSDQAITPEQNGKIGNSDVRLRKIHNVQKGQLNDLPSTKTALIQADDKGYLPSKITTDEAAKNGKPPLETCPFDRRGKSNPPGCTPKTSKENNITHIFANQGFEIPVPSNKNLYSKLPYGGNSKVKSNGQLPYLKVDKVSPPRLSGEKHKILNIPGNGVPLISLYEQSNKRRQEQDLSPPFLKSLTSSEEEFPVLIISKADAQNNGRNQKVYLNTIKSDVKNNANQEPFGDPLNLHLPEATNTPDVSPPTNPLPTAPAKDEISWAHYVKPSKTKSEKSLKGINQ